MLAQAIPLLDICSQNYPCWWQLSLCLSRECRREDSLYFVGELWSSDSWLNEMNPVWCMLESFI